MIGSAISTPPSDAGSTTRSGGEGDDEPGIFAPREPTERMMDAGLYASSHDSTYADVHSIWKAMFDSIAEDGGSTSKLPIALATTSSPDASLDSGEAGLRTALIGGPLDDEAQSTLGRFGWLSAIITDLKSCPAAMSALAAEDPASAAEAMSEVEALLWDVRLALARPSSSPAIVKEAGE